MPTFSISDQTNGSPKPSFGQNNHGAIMNAGNVASGSQLVDDVSLGLSRHQDALTVQLAASLGTAKAVSAGAFQYFDASKYVIMKVSETLGGVSNSVLLTGSSIPGLRRKVASVGSVRTQFLQALSWTASGHELPAYTSTVSDHNVVFWSISGNATSATADNATTAVTNGKLKGEITYRDGSFLPFDDVYHTQE